MRWCEERGIGLKFGGSIVPIVPAAVLFDLPTGRRDVRPTAESGYQACGAAKGGRVREGSVGAGTGLTVAKAGGPGTGLKGGIGTASEELEAGIVVGAMVAVNAGGEIVDSRDGSVVAGPRDFERGGFRDTFELIRRGSQGPVAGANTTVGVVATNAKLTKEQTNRLATLAHDGFARAIRPCHTMSDGDTVFALATGAVELPERGLRALEAFTPIAVERAIVKAARAATSLAGVPSAADWLSGKWAPRGRRR
jgi:L-aminopeptidase/D-esterase-like protein